jgi:hypothetical protein
MKITAVFGTYSRPLEITLRCELTSAGAVLCLARSLDAIRDRPDLNIVALTICSLADGCAETVV